MSASLVGSEMCIRDRLKGYAQLETKRAQKRALGSKRSICWTDHANSVSYTHLTLPTICSV
eukprot:6478491-Alexandrium_andersonii.AAC.1